MSARLDKRMEEKNGALKKTGDEVTVSEEMEKIRKENDRLRILLLKEDVVNEGSKVATLQKEIMELKQQAMVKKVAEDDIFSMKQEIEQLRSSALAKGNFESKLDGLRTEVSRLKIQGMKDREEVEAWKGEALRPGNTRGSVVIDTPDGLPRGSPRPRWTDNIRESDKWKQEYVKMKEMHRAASREARVLKGKRAVAEGEAIKLKEQLNKVPVEEFDTQRERGGTNLKTRLEAVANRYTRKGLKATPRRDMGVCAESFGAANEHFHFIEAQKKDLRNYKKSGLEM
ncbi:hypothetical protein CBR_g29747 [Chara braunii]|uniref:Uncharacterized protein n=1 Tax=Chara braunii TaxID=69332 RepID=A0A388LBA8_CHABU|nr:hypothetical protein CBR_g29747 [Chara braunii]|eukprot:GBG79599.1 hypothetical protein CBR_g29747 [Chara braunii]